MLLRSSSSDNDASRWKSECKRAQGPGCPSKWGTCAGLRPCLGGVALFPCQCESRQLTRRSVEQKEWHDEVLSRDVTNSRHSYIYKYSYGRSQQFNSSQLQVCNQEINLPIWHRRFDRIRQTALLLLLLLSFQRRLVRFCSRVCGKSSCTKGTCRWGPQKPPRCRWWWFQSLVMSEWLHTPSKYTGQTGKN